MELLSVTQCKSDLSSFIPATWPASLPGLALHGHLLIRNPRGQEVLNCALPAKSDELHLFLQELMPQLGLAQIAQLLAQQTFCQLLDTQQWLKGYGIPDSEQAHENLEKLRELPLEFQEWVNAKKLGYREIAVLSVIAKEHDLGSAFKKIAELSYSRQQGVRVLEWLCELAAMGETCQELLVASDLGQSQWMSHLQKKRYPTSSARDTTLAKQTSEIRWPKDTQGSWTRRGDIAGLELRIFASSGEDLTKKLQKLEALKGELESRFFHAEENG